MLIGRGRMNDSVLRVLHQLVVRRDRCTIHTGWIDEIRRAVGDVAVEIGVARGEAAGVLTNEAAGVRVVPAGVVPIQAGARVEHLAGEREERLIRRIALGGSIPERIVLEVIDDGRGVGGGVVLDDGADVPRLSGSSQETTLVEAFSSASASSFGPLRILSVSAPLVSPIIPPDAFCLAVSPCRSCIPARSASSAGPVRQTWRPTQYCKTTESMPSL